MDLDREMSPSSQPNMLRNAIEKKGIRHGDESEVDITNIEVSSVACNTENCSSTKKTGVGVQAYFCNSQVSSVLFTKKGDGEKLPNKIILKGIKLPNQYGMYTLKNVIIQSNGNIVVSRGPNTKIVSFKNEKVLA